MCPTMIMEGRPKLDLNKKMILYCNAMDTVMVMQIFVMMQIEECNIDAFGTKRSMSLLR